MLYRWTLYLLSPLNIARLLLTLAWGLAAVLLLFRFLPQSMRNAIARLWSRTLLRVVGVRLVVRGEELHGSQGPQGPWAWTGLAPEGPGLLLRRAALLEAYLE